MKPALQNFLATSKGRVLALNGLSAQPGNFAGLDTVFDTALKGATPEQAAALAGLVERARTNDPASITELAEFRLTTIDTYVRATNNFAALFFRGVNLGATQTAAFQHTFRHPVNVRYVGQDGGVRISRLTKSQKQVLIDLRELWTDDVEYPLRDINQGTDVAGMAQATVDLSWDLTHKINKDAKTLLDAALGAFVTTGAKLDRTWVAHPDVLTAGLPTTNILTLSGNTASTKFRMAAIEAIIKYCDSWGNLFGAPVRPTGAILIPASESTGLVSEFSPTGLTSNAVADGVLANYTQFSYMNVNWTLIPDVTLGLGKAYVVLNRPVGEVYYKPSFDREDVKTNVRENWERRATMKVINFATPEPWRPFVLQVVYHS